MAPLTHQVNMEGKKQSTRLELCANRYVNLGPKSNSCKLSAHRIGHKGCPISHRLHIIDCHEYFLYIIFVYISTRCISYLTFVLNEVKSIDVGADSEETLGDAQRGNM